MPLCVLNYRICLLFAWWYTSLLACYFMDTVVYSARVRQSDNKCGALPEYQRRVLVGWSWNLTCNVLVAHLSVKDPFPCMITKQRTQFNDTVVITATEESHNLTFFVTKNLENMSCVQMKVVIIPQQEESCSKSLVQVTNNQPDIIINISSEQFGLEYLDCVPDNSGSFLSGKDLSQYNATWYKTNLDRNLQIVDNQSCQEVTERWFHLFNSTTKQYVININFLQAGIYMCRMNYKNSTFFTSFYRICVAQRFDDIEPTLVCPTSISFVTGETVIIECTAQTDIAELSENDLIVTWSEKQGEETKALCRSENLKDVTIVNERRRCGITGFTNEPRKCFLFQPVPEDLRDQTAHNSYRVFFMFSNPQKSEAGTYMVQMKYRNIRTKFHKITLIYDITAESKILLFLLAAILGTSIFVVAIIALAVYYQFKIKLFLRRHFGKCDEDNKRFVVSLLYTIPQSDDMRPMIKAAHRWITEKLKKLGYSYFDFHEHTEAGTPRGESVIAHFKNSHRVIVLLTAEYIEMSTSRFEVSQALFDMLENKTKLILICFPGARDALNRSRDNRNLHEAFHATRKLTFNTKTSENRFKDKLEYALPNLRLHSPTETTNDTGIIVNAVTAQMSLGLSSCSNEKANVTVDETSL